MATCSICRSDDRTAIDSALVTGASIRDTAGQFAVAKSSLHRHLAHLPDALRRAQDAREVLDADRLLEDLLGLEAATWSLLEDAEEEGDRKTQLAALRDVRACLELRAKIVGTISNAKVDVNVTTVPEPPMLVAVEEYLGLVDEIIEGEKRYRATDEEVGGAVQGVGSGDAIDHEEEPTDETLSAPVPEWIVEGRRVAVDRAVRSAFAM